MQDLSKKSSAPRWLLNSLHANELPASTPISPAGVTLGRDSGNTIAIPPERFPGVSGAHARVWVEGETLFLEDLGSRNGTLVNGEPVEKIELDHGGTFELGNGGPRFVVLSSAKLDKTVAMPRPREVAQKVAMGDETVSLVREKLGLEQVVDTQVMVERRSRRTRIMVLALSLTLIVGFAAGFWIVKDRSDRAEEALAGIQEENVRLREQLAANEQTVTEQIGELERRGAELDLLRIAWDTEKTTLEEERTRLVVTIEQLGEDDRTTSGELALLRTKLDETNSTLEMYNPLNLEVAKLQEVARVEHCTVLIEADQIFKDEATGKILHVTDDGPFGPSVNFEDEGEPLMVEATGSGFCLTSEGWIITNAHVVHKKDEEEPFRIGPDIELVPEVQLRVVFSGESKRHAATLVRWAADGREDLALLKIEPFEDMPYLEEPEIDAPPPNKGSEVFLIGFPLGKRVFHEGDVMLASTFKGVLSRVLDDYLQVDAAVHPGASGGPLIDGRGRIIGVVVGMQTVDENAASSAIGYIIPASQLSRVWPPPTE